MALLTESRDVILYVCCVSLSGVIITPRMQMRSIFGMFSRLTQAQSLRHQTIRNSKRERALKAVGGGCDTILFWVLGHGTGIVSTVTQTSLGVSLMNTCCTHRKRCQTKLSPSIQWHSLVSRTTLLGCSCKENH